MAIGHKPKRYYFHPRHKHGEESRVSVQFPSLINGISRPENENPYHIEISHPLPNKNEIKNADHTHSDQHDLGH